MYVHTTYVCTYDSVYIYIYIYNYARNCVCVPALSGVEMTQVFERQMCNLCDSHINIFTTDRRWLSSYAGK